MGQARKKTEGGSAGRLAAGRRPGRGVEKPPAKSGGKSAGKGLKGKAKKAGSSNPIARGFKLVVLLGLMAVVGFALVLVVDVGASIVGRARFGEITFADLFDKVSDRVLDRDVPEPKKKDPAKAAAQKTTTKPEAAPPKTSSTPQKAPSPEDYAKHVEPQQDPEVEQAKQRLDALLKNL